MGRYNLSTLTDEVEFIEPTVYYSSSRYIDKPILEKKDEVTWGEKTIAFLWGLGVGIGLVLMLL